MIFLLSILFVFLIINIYEKENYYCYYDCANCQNFSSYGVKTDFLLKSLESRDELVNFGKTKGYPDGCVFTGENINCFRYFGDITQSQKFSVMTDFVKYLQEKYNEDK